MEDNQVYATAFATDEADPLFTAILAYPGTPKSQFQVVTMGMHENSVIAPGRHPTVVDSVQTSLGAQIDLLGILANPTLLVFLTDIVLDVHIC